MKMLAVLRHGKSSWGNPELADRDRPLKPKGMRRTRVVAETLGNRYQFRPDRIVVSPACRAAQTAQIAAMSLQVPETHCLDNGWLYGASPKEVLEVAQGIREPRIRKRDVNKVLLIGHNPSLTYLVNRFLPEPLDNLPTSGCVGLRFDVRNWADIAEAAPEVLFVLIPKQLESNCD